MLAAFASLMLVVSLLVHLGRLLLLTYLFLQHIAFMVAMRRGYLPFVRAALSARGYPTCAACGHLLGPSDPQACPECGSGHRALR